MEAEFMLVAITRPEFYEGEADDITSKLAGDFNRVHIRKPGASTEAVRNLLIEIPEALHCKLSLHDGHELIEEFPNVRLHYNSRTSTTEPMKPYSVSIHSLDEWEKWAEADYMLLSPIFDSISKPGYRARFSPAELQGDDRLRNIVALGGVIPRRIDELRRAGFRGAAMLGAAGWKTRNKII